MSACFHELACFLHLSLPLRALALATPLAAALRRCPRSLALDTCSAARHDTERAVYRRLTDLRIQPAGEQQGDCARERNRTAQSGHGPKGWQPRRRRAHIYKTDSSAYRQMKQMSKESTPPPTTPHSSCVLSPSLEALESDGRAAHLGDGNEGEDRVCGGGRVAASQRGQQRRGQQGPRATHRPQARP